MQPKVSVIVPVYRVEPYLARCVESLLGQTLRELEIILVDDGSPDGCPALCDGYAARDPRVRVIHQENRGQGFARNAGLDIATGAYVGFADSDDFLLPEMFESLFRAAEEAGADMVLSGIRYRGGAVFGEEDREELRHCFAKAERFEGAAGRERLMLGLVGAEPWEPEDSRYNFAVWKNLYRRAFLEERHIRFLSEREWISEDVLFLLDVASHCPQAVGIPGAWYCYCRNGDSFSKKYRADRFARQKQLAAEMERRLGAWMPPSRYQLYVDRYLESSARVALVQEAVRCRAEGLPAREANRRLRACSADETLQTVLRRYPWWKLPRMQAAFAFAMRFRMARLQRWMVALREKL